jgi:hypothetical protein
MRMKVALILTAGLLVAATSREIVKKNDTSRPSAVLSWRAPPAHITPEAVADFLKRQAALIKSRKFLAAVARRPAVAGLKLIKQQTDPGRWLQKNLRLEFPKGVTTLRITLPGKTSGDQAVVVDVVADAYLKEIIDSRPAKRKRKQFLVRESLAFKEAVQHRQKIVNQYLQQANNAADPKASQVYLRIAKDVQSGVEALQKEEKDNKHEMEALTVDLQMASRIRIVQRAKAAE